MQAEAKAAIARIYGAEIRADALVAMQAFADRFAEWPEATAKITGEFDTLLASLPSIGYTCG
jgi:hypothetical protein